MSLQQVGSHHLLPLITLSYIAGILSSILPVNFQSNTFSPYLVLSLTALILLFCSSRWQKTAFIALIILFIQLGNIAGKQEQRLPNSPHHIYSNISKPQEAVILGTIKRIYSFNGDVSRFDLQSHSLRTETENFRPVAGVIRLTLVGEFPQHIVPGNVVALRAKLKRPQKYYTAGSFDYPGFLAQQDIYITGFIRSHLHLQPVEDKASLGKRVVFLPERLRTSINRFIESSLESDQAAIYKAILTGDRTSVSPGTLENFKSSGCMHILAISGIHMSLLGVFLFTVFFWLLRRSSWLILHTNVKKGAVICCIIPLIFYAFIAGAKPPVLRSLFMSLVVIGAICFGKKHSFSALIAFAALCLLTFSPSALFTPSFQLTFAAVIAIAAVVPWIAQINGVLNETVTSFAGRKILQWLTAGFLVSLAATLGTAPLLIIHFNRISLVGPAANLLVEPVLCMWTLLIGFVAIPFIWIMPAFAEYLFQTGSFGISSALYIVDFFASLPFSSLYLPTISYLHLLFFYLCWLILFLTTDAFKALRLMVASVLAVTILLMFFSPKEITKNFLKESTLTFIDVGQGSSTLIELPGGARVLVDGGAISSPGFNIGERIIAPFLLNKRIQKIDTLVVTHPDSDHYNGLAHIMKHFKVSTLYVNQADGISKGWNVLLETAREYNITIRVAEENELVASHGKASLRIISKGTVNHPTKSRNDNGIVLKYSHDNFSAIFPGDITAQREKELIYSSVDLQANLLLAAHHGSATSNTSDFLQEVAPDLVIVSSGRSWQGTFPSPLLSENCRKLGIEFLPISKRGTIAIKTKAGEYAVRTLLP